MACRFVRRLAAVTLLAAASLSHLCSAGRVRIELPAHATSKDLGTYFPTYLANGYLSTMTAPRGTESNLAYVVAFMDYTKEDIARPAPSPAGAELTTAGSVERRTILAN